jgi:hypothetical protein
LTLGCLPIFRPKERIQSQKEEEEVRNNYPNTDFGLPSLGSMPFRGM